jgi:hypothetical protein
VQNISECFLPAERIDEAKGDQRLGGKGALQRLAGISITIAVKVRVTSLRSSCA